MKRILGLVSSQRKLANGEILVKEAARACGVDYELSLVRLPDLRLEPCRGCYTCLVPGRNCPIGDDLYFLADQIKTADALIWAAPCYALGPAAVNKLLGDRIIALAQRLGDFWRKPCVVIGTAGIQGWEGYTLAALLAEARFLGFDVKDAAMFIGALPGEGLHSEARRERVRQLGLALFGASRQARSGECPTCWSDIWKFPEPGLAVCPLCGQKAHIRSTDGQWDFCEPGTRFERENLENHFHEWLRGKVDEFVVRRAELAVIRNQYKEKDMWLRPQGREDTPGSR